MKTLEGNKLIAEYAGWKSNFWNEGIPPSYDSDWNALMPVVDKIEAQDKVNIQISCYGCEISDRIMMNTRNIVSEPIKEKKITAVWTAVVNYLKNKKD